MFLYIHKVGQYSNSNAKFSNLRTFSSTPKRNLVLISRHSPFCFPSPLSQPLSCRVGHSAFLRPPAQWLQPSFGSYEKSCCKRLRTPAFSLWANRRRGARPPGPSARARWIQRPQTASRAGHRLHPTGGARGLSWPRVLAGGR